MKKILIFSLIALMFSCEDFLVEEPLGQVVGSSALNSVEGLQLALNGAYQPIMGNNFTTGFNTAAVQAVGMGSDDLTTLKGGNKGPFREMDQFNVTNLNSRMDDIWNGCYKSIQSCSNVINNYNLVSANASIINPMAGEAYFLRAFNYYWLVRLWGSIPLVTSENYNSDLLDLTKSSPADVYKLIEADLLKAIEMLTPTKKDPGRPSAGSAKALLADVYLTMSGWPLKDASKLATAVTLANDVITNKATYKFDLLTNFADLWTGTQASVATKEEVFAFQFCGSCSYLMGNSMYGQSAQPSEESGWDDFFPELKFFNDFPAGVRKDATFYLLANGNPWQSSSSQHPHYKKFIISGQWFTSQSLMMMRYAHVLLIYAEAKARTSGPDQSAYDALNAIRTRAGLAALSGLSTADFITAVINERAWEFAGEGTTRWFDLTRLEMVQAVNAAKDPADLKPLGSTSTYYLPVPAADANLNPNL